MTPRPMFTGNPETLPICRSRLIRSAFSAFTERRPFEYVTSGAPAGLDESTLTDPEDVAGCAPGLAGGGIEGLRSDVCAETTGAAAPINRARTVPSTAP